MEVLTALDKLMIKWLFWDWKMEISGFGTDKIGHAGRT